MVETGAGPNNIFRQLKKIQISDIHYQAHEFFGLIGIGNVGNNVLPKLLVVSALQSLDGSANQLHNLYKRVRSDMISKSVEGSITKTSL